MFFNKDTIGIVIKYLSIKEKIIISKINRELNKYLKDTLGKLYYLIDDINKIETSHVIRDVIFPNGHNIYKLFKISIDLDLISCPS